MTFSFFVYALIRLRQYTQLRTRFHTLFSRRSNSKIELRSPCPAKGQRGTMLRDVLAAVIQLAHAVDLEVIAEGIEDADIMQTLLAIGCESGEGFHFSRPIPADDFESEWISRFSAGRIASA